ncbi:hypothetical protein D3C81_1663500 [compost metagenome]
MILTGTAVGLDERIIIRLHIGGCTVGDAPGVRGPCRKVVFGERPAFQCIDGAGSQLHRRNDGDACTGERIQSERSVRGNPDVMERSVRIVCDLSPVCAVGPNAEELGIAAGIWSREQKLRTRREPLDIAGAGLRDGIAGM